MDAKELGRERMYPVNEVGDFDYGLTKREAFMLAALPEAMRAAREKARSDPGLNWRLEAAWLACEQADALLAELAKGE